MPMREIFTQDDLYEKKGSDKVQQSHFIQIITNQWYFYTLFVFWSENVHLFTKLGYFGKP